MKLRILFIVLSLFVSIQWITAQTMTDDQIVSYVQQRKSAGASNKMIGTELLSKGATRDQIKRVAKKLQGAGGTTSTNSPATINRGRVNNEEKSTYGEGKGSLAGKGSRLGGREDFLSEEDDEIFDFDKKIFGHDIFRSKELSFEPNMDMAISPTYVLGPGDELIIDVYGASQNSQSIKVAPDGTVTIPKIGPVGVSGLTVEQAQSRIRGAMGGHYQNSSIKVSVGQTRTITISIMGEVKTPGTYTLSAFATVFHALYMAGGVNELGTMRDIKVARNGRIISTVDVYEYILTGRLAGSVSLKDNDVIIVGSYDNLVQIAGKVKRPMWYEMKKNETLSALVRFCGGFTGDAYSKSVTVNRRAGEKLSVYTVEEFDFPKFKLADEDSVSVGMNEQRYENKVCVAGAVKRPGRYGLSSVKTVRGLIEAAGGLQEDAVKNRAVIVRMNEDRTRKTVSVELADILTGSSADVPLENEDSMVIASRAIINDFRKMTIQGEVWSPGTFPYAENTTVEDLITMAGGLKESASLLNVEISRRIIDPTAERDSIINCETISYNLDSNSEVGSSNTPFLKPYDRVYIRRSPVYEEQHSVNVSGEVLFAGNYTLKDNKTRLSEIITKCGGLKKNGSARNARLIRKMDDTEYARALQLQKMAANSSDTIQVDSITSTYSVGIDLDMALDNPGSDYDIILRNGDRIIVPSLINTVKISGEVLYPNSVTYMEGKKARYYVSQAGGYTKKSLKSHAYIIYANGHVSQLSDGKIEPGCEIVVPTKPEKKESSNEVMKWVSICSSIATVAAVLVTAFKK